MLASAVMSATHHDSTKVSAGQGFGPLRFRMVGFGGAGLEFFVCHRRVFQGINKRREKAGKTGNPINGGMLEKATRAGRQ